MLRVHVWVFNRRAKFAVEFEFGISIGTYAYGAYGRIERKVLEAVLECFPCSTLTIINQ